METAYSMPTSCLQIFTVYGLTQKEGMDRLKTSLTVRTVCILMYLNKRVLHIPCFQEKILPTLVTIEFLANAS